MGAREQHIEIKKTARYYQIGEINDTTEELWITLHGYGQLASYFIRHFAPFEQPSRCIIAPEALSRFYLSAESGRVGATWMTKEDRLNEMEDYIAYLDSLYAALSAKVGTEKNVRITLIGFSQGVSAACRWALRGKAEVNRLIMWAGSLPPEIDLKMESSRINTMNPVLVAGTEDQFISRANREAVANILKTSGIHCEIVTFEGKHVIHAPTLQALLG
ncbi:MAG: alpha/beta hydrolase [Calditrichia bacterium]